MENPLTHNELLAWPGAVDRKIPLPVSPQLPTLKREPVSGEGWLHELKHDGYRLIIHAQSGHVQTFTRGGENWTDKLEVVAAAAQDLAADDVVIDAELVAINDQGRSSFSLLQRAIGHMNARLYAFAFDLLQIEGVDLRSVPLYQRKTLLKQIIPSQGRIRYSEHILAPAADLYKEACRLGAEGIVSKRINSLYRSGRSTDWIKVKCVEQQSFFVGGFTSRYGNPLASLLLGRMENGKLIYTGRVGTGFSQQDIDMLLTLLRKQVQKESPFNGRQPSLHRGDQNHWVPPRMQVDINFSELTDSGCVRHASFKGIHNEKL